MSTPSTPILRFEPVYQSRVWGGRALAEKFGRTLPEAGTPYGESWEISARPEAESRVRAGEHAGRSLSDLWSDPETRRSIFGQRAPDCDRFPLLCKILDAREKLSIQVHPPADVAQRLGGEPKTEVWYIAHAEPGAELYVGVERGVTQDSFHTALTKGAAEDLVHALPVRTGQHILIRSGRLHAIGAGIIIYEIQQNSDTTYRVYDWNRLGLDGKPRDLHISESLQCIDFDDVEPRMDETKWALLSECEHFRVEKHRVGDGYCIADAIEGRFAIVTVVSGQLARGEETFRPGDFFIVPVNATRDLPKAKGEDSEILVTVWP